MSDSVLHPDKTEGKIKILKVYILFFPFILGDGKTESSELTVASFDRITDMTALYTAGFSPI
jgi:hypothetical protein